MERDKARTDGVLPLIQLISSLVEKRCDRFLNSRYGLTTPQYQLLLAALENTDATLGSLSQHLNCSRGNITGIVDRLERDEWLTRERSTEDRRVITVCLTEKGHRIREIKQALSRELEDLSQIWDSKQKKEVSQLLLRMYKELKD